MPTKKKSSQYIVSNVNSEFQAITLLLETLLATFVTKQNVMVERIRTLLETRQLTPTQFADLIGVARPIVSHILSGRNKPSLEVVQRILAALPELSMPWLLNGTGTIYSATGAAVQVPHATPGAIAVPVATIAPVAAPIVVPPVAAAIAPPEPLPPTRTPSIINSLSAGNVGIRSGSNGYPGPKRFTPRRNATPPESVEIPPAPALLASVPVVEADSSVPLQSPSMPAPDTSPSPDGAEALSGNDDSTAAALFAGTEKPIRRIVIFYRDGSFADYQPE